ncbi:MAG: DUF11 domain-containing protein, partial [Actinomycetota bacterium]|nr:DUF11 domain-containing protein [Actinomycetota bacterium]
AITAPSLSVRKIFSGTTRDVYQTGTPISFDIGIENTGDTTITHLPLIDEFDPAMLQFVSATPPVDSVTASTVGWTDLTSSLGDLAPGQTATVTVTFTAVGVGETVNTAVVPDGAATDEFGDPVPGDRAERPFGIYSPDQLGLSKTADPPAGTILLPGDTITYFIAFSNTTGLAIPDVELLDELPDSVTYVPGTIMIDQGDGSLVGRTDAAGDDEGTFDPAAGNRGTVIARMSQVPAGTTVTLSFRVTVREAEFSRQGVRNYASATSAGDEIAQVDPVDHHVDPFDIIKTARDLNGGRLVAGDLIEWTIKVTNTGLVPTTHVVVTDEVPSQTTYVDGSITGRGADDSDASRLVWNVGTMQVDESVTLTFRSRVKSGLASGTSIRNQAVVTADQSPAKRSDAPETSEVGDPTMLQTGANDWIWVLSVLALLLAAAVAWWYSRRLRRA